MKIPNFTVVIFNIYKKIIIIYMNKIVHFSEESTLDDINDFLKNKNGILYFTRYIPNKKQFHIINHDNGEFEITPFITKLLDFYKKRNIKFDKINIKGNDTFAILMNVNNDMVNILKNDLNKLLKK